MAEPEALEKVEEVATKKVGPFPIWVYILIPAVLALGYYLYKRYRGGSTAATATAAGTVATEDTTDQGTGAGTDSPAVPSTSQPDAETNTEWALRAGNGLIATGMYNATDVTNALAVLLAGGTPTATQETIINAAETQYGLPPEGIIATPGAPTTTATSNTNSYHTLKTPTGGESIESVIQKTYGEDDAAILAAFWAANNGSLPHHGDNTTLNSTSATSKLIKGNTLVKLPVFSGPLP